ncbi:MAG: hypothetical protein DHS20C18_00530 [Saprospiraceae bacterium]|nr:MAG: hypothetical protein DHS20C18_00530 [Saprospiraceae bacterium]
MLLLVILWWYIWKRREDFRLEKLRKQIARDFHDELGTHLSIIQMYSQLVRQELDEQADHTTAVHLEKISQSSKEIYEAVRDLIWAIDPGRDAVEDLLIRIRESADAIFEDSGINFTFKQKGNQSKKLLPIGAKKQLLLILKEAMNNVLKHADSNAVSLDVSFHKNRLCFNLSDCGKGFDTTRSYLGSGLKNMQARAATIGAQLTITSTSVEGTSISIEYIVP